METNAAQVPPPSAVTEPTKIQTRPDPPSAAIPAQDLLPNAPADISQPADYRLVIDKDPVSGTFIYKTIDRYSGTVVKQFPREELARIGDSQTYTAGTIITAKV